MKYSFTFFICVFSIFKVGAQGCSDAGFCSIGDIKARGIDTASETKSKWSLFLTSGIGDQGVFVFTQAVQYDRFIRHQWEIQAKLTGNYASGNLGVATGPGDIFLSTTFHLKSKKNLNNSITLGTKLPLSQSDLTSQSVPLPMQYQSSLGTVDVIIGYAIKFNRLFANAAWQQPLTGANHNAYLPNPNTTDATRVYAPGNLFNRKGDVLLRFGYQILNKTKIKWNASALCIYHLGEDTYSDKAIQQDPIQISGSNGLTLNITSMVSFKLSRNFGFAVSGGAPLIVRKVRPDGLTRAFSITPELSYIF